MKKRLGTLVIGAMTAAAMVLTACGGSSSGNAAPAATEAATEAAATEAAATETAGTEAAGTEAATEAAVEPSDYVLNFAASHTSGAFYQWAVPVSEVITNYAGIQCNPITTNGAVEAIEFMRSGELNMAGNACYTVYSAMNGLDDWADKKADFMSVMWGVYPEYFYLMVPGNSDVNTLADLEGKRLSINVAGNTTNALSRHYFDTLGYDIESFVKVYELSAAESVEAMKDGSIDAYIIGGGGLGSSNVLDLASSQNGLKLIPLTDEEIGKLCAAYPFLSEGVIPGGSYPGIDEDVKTVISYTPLYVNNDVPEDVVYNAIKAINEHQPELESVVASAHYTTAEDTAKYLVDANMPLHPGMVKYLKELGLMQ